MIKVKQCIRLYWNSRWLIVLWLLVGGCKEKQFSDSTVHTPTVRIGDSQNTTITADTANTVEPSLSTDDPMLGMAKQLIFQGQYEDAITLLNQAQGDDMVMAKQLLGIAYLESNQVDEAQQIFNQLSQSEGFGSAAYYWLGRSYQMQGDCQNAAASDNLYLLQNADMIGYIKPLSADCYADHGGSIESQIISLEEAIGAEAHQRKAFFTRVKLANIYMSLAEYDKAAPLYGQARFIAQTDYSKAEMGYLEGYANKQNGNEKIGYQQMSDVVNQYPEQTGSYQALFQLVQADRPVDPYQRGVIDYYAAAYLPCVEILTDYVETAANPIPDSYYYLAQCYGEMNEVLQARTWFERYSETAPENAVIGQMETADLLANDDQIVQAIAIYDNIVETRPIDPQAPEALWLAANLVDKQLKKAEIAIERYTALANRYDWYDHTAEALFRAGNLAKTLQRTGRANEIWWEAVQNYPDTSYGRASLVKLLRQSPDDSELLQVANSIDNYPAYHSTRIRDLVDGVSPFSAVDFAWDKQFDQTAAEAWLMKKAPISTQPLAQLPPHILNDAGFQRGKKLLTLRLWAGAYEQFEEIRLRHEDDIWINYQFALFYRDHRLYRSSIRTATNLLRLTDSTSYSAPAFIASLAWPTYYGELVVESAEKYNIDPLLKFALLRQESLFDSLAISSAAAQGLAQVMPATGQDIADALDWNNYTTAELLRPIVGIEFGSYYLDLQLEIFDNTMHAALTGYNAGAGNAARWYHAAGDDLDAFVDEVNFPESKSYVERIYAGHAIYRHLYGN